MSTFGSDSTSDFLEYARTQHDLGVELAEQHVVEATGCCRSCGRTFPCDGYRHGQQMRAHFETWLLNPPIPSAGRGDFTAAAKSPRTTRPAS